MSLNFQCFMSYPKDEQAGLQRLREVLGGPCPPDAVCVQEGLSDRDVLGTLGYEQIVCSAKHSKAQSVREMVYSDEATLKCCSEEILDKYLCNQIYVRRESPWRAVRSGVEQISSELDLQGGAGRAEGTLAVRSVAWTKLHKAGGGASDVVLLNTHLTGGRFEDQFFVQQLAQERLRQPERIMELFEKLAADTEDVGIMVGDFNATPVYTDNGAMHNYFKSSIANSEGVKQDAAGEQVGDEGALEDLFSRYMTSPFGAIRQRGWHFAYGEEVGVTSCFGHLIDHMASSRALKVVSAEVLYLTNQKIGQKPKDTEVPLTDHNAVKAVFSVAASHSTPSADRAPLKRACSQPLTRSLPSQDVARRGSGGECQEAKLARVQSDRLHTKQVLAIGAMLA